MCFSASASFGASAIIGGVGVAALPMVRDRRELLFASLPLAFSAHQFLEGVIWLQVDQAGGTPVRSPAVIAWLCFAWLVLPIWVPVSVYLFEPDVRRRRWLLGLAGLGAIIGSCLFASSFAVATTVVASRTHLEYGAPLHPGWLFAVPYVAATCLPPLLSSRRFVNHFGAALVASMAVSTAMAAKEFSSVWCFFAALLSLSLLVHFVLEHQEARSVESAASASTT